MKKTFLLTAIATIMLGLFSCKNEQPQTLEDILRHKYWTYSSYTLETPNDTIDYLDSITFREKYLMFRVCDCRFQFSTAIEGIVPYDSTIWYFNKKQDTLTLDFILNNGQENPHKVISVQQILSFTEKTFETKEIRENEIHWRNYRILNEEEIDTLWLLNLW
jgi:hypothetical protein